jgi:hypothetical protein
LGALTKWSFSSLGYNAVDPDAFAGAPCGTDDRVAEFHARNDAINFTDSIP